MSKALNGHALEHVYCIESCQHKHQGEECGPMLKCANCLRWYHKSCVNISPSAQIIGLWVCFGKCLNVVATHGNLIQNIEDKYYALEERLNVLEIQQELCRSNANRIEVLETQIKNLMEKSCSPGSSGSQSPNSQLLLLTPPVSNGKASNQQKTPNPEAKDAELRKELALLEKMIKIDDTSTRAIVELVIEAVLSKIRDMDPFYKDMFRNVKYTGSYFEGLRIKEATEFDLNIVLALPGISKSFIKIINDGCPEGFAKLKIDQPLDKINFAGKSESYKRILKTLLDEDGDQIVMPEKIRKMFQGLLAKVQSDLNITGVSKIDFTASGPARTLCIYTTKGVKIDVDFVPVFRFGLSEWPDNIQENYFRDIRKINKDFFLVPKAYVKTIRQNCREPKEKERPKLWRMHTPELEISVFEKRKFAKPLIKILKFLRDGQTNWSPIASYFLKTVVMYEVMNKNTIDDWNDASSAKRFIEALQSLEKYVHNEKLPSFIFPNFNLFQSIDKVVLVNIEMRISKILSKVKEDPAHLRNFFPTPEPCL